LQIRFNPVPRSVDPKCLYCAKHYNEAEAQTKNQACYVPHNCRVKRYRLKHRSQINAKRRLKTAQVRGVVMLPEILPSAYTADLILEGKKHKFVAAVSLRIYQGNQLIAQMPPQRTKGLKQPQLEDYIYQLLEYLKENYDISCFATVYWHDPL
jgi:hypothetical protein